MAVEIKSGNSSDLQTVDAVSKAARVTLYNSDGVEGTKEIPVALSSAPVIIVDNDIISSIDVTEYKSISLQLTGIWTGTVTFQGSNDNGTFYDIVAQDATSLTAPYSYDTTVNGLYSVPVVYKYFRARVTTYVSGTVDCTAYGHKEDKSLNSVGQIGSVSLNAETTKIIGTVNVATGASYVAGTITSSDTNVASPTHNGSLLSGTPSVDSYFTSAGNSAFSTWVVEIAGALGGASFYFEGSTGSTNGVDGNWVSLTSIQSGLINSPLSYFTTTAGKFSGNATGLSYFRVRAVGGVGVNATIDLNFSRGAIAVNFNSPLPAGTNTVGSVNNVAQLGGAAVSMGAGVVDAGTQRVSLTSDEPVALKAGASIIGSVDDLAKIGGVAVSMGAGVVDAGTQRVSLTSDEPIALKAGASIIGSVDDLAKIGGVAVSMGAGVSDAGTQRVSLTSDEPVALKAGASVIGSVDDLAKIGGVAVSMGGGVSDAGTQRVSIASDEPIALAAGATTIGSLDNVAKLGGVAVSMGGGVSDAGTQRVSIASDEPIALAAGATTIGSLDNVAKLGGVAVSMGAGVVDSGTQRVVLPDNPPLSTDFYVTAVGAVDNNSRVIRSGACILKAAVFTSYAATPRHIKLYDTATTPTAGVGSPVLVLTRAASGNNSYPLPEGGFPFANGIAMTFVQGAASNNAVGTATVDGSLTCIFT